MPKHSRAVSQLPPATLAALEQLGADLAVARLRRRESLKTWAKRLGVTVQPLMRLESGDPGVGVGILASALWLIGRDSELAKLVFPEKDKGALELDVSAAKQLGRERARASTKRGWLRAKVRTHCTAQHRLVPVSQTWLVQLLWRNQPGGSRAHRLGARPPHLHLASSPCPKGST